MTDERLNEAISQLYEVHQTVLREQMGLSDDWTLRDIPWMTLEDFNKIVEIAGKGNIRFVSGSTRNDWKNGPHQRASAFMNETARLNFVAYNEQEGA